MARAGGRNWWTVLVGRVRAQRVWKLHRGGERSVGRRSAAGEGGLKRPPRPPDVALLKSGG